MRSDGLACAFLDKDGCCSVYEARPIICRSHGAPVSWTEIDGLDKAEMRDVCPLNFQDVNLESLDGQSVISLEKINTLLSLINRHYLQSDSLERLDLSLIAERAKG